MRLAVLICVCCFITSASADEFERPAGTSIPLEQSDWPCKSGYQPELEGKSSWPRLALQDRIGIWQTTPGVKALVEAVAANSRSEQAVLQIDQFAASLDAKGSLRDQILADVFLGLREEMNFYRNIVLYGIMQGVANARLASNVAAHGDRNASRDDRTSARALRVEDDALDDARFLCHRLGALEDKFHALTEALAQHLTLSSG